MRQLECSQPAWWLSLTCRRCEADLPSFVSTPTTLFYPQHATIQKQTDSIEGVAVNTTLKLMHLLNRTNVPMAVSTLKPKNAFPLMYRAGGLVSDVLPMLNPADLDLEGLRMRVVLQKPGQDALTDVLAKAKSPVTIVATGAQGFRVYCETLGGGKVNRQLPVEVRVPATHSSLSCLPHPLLFLPTRWPCHPQRTCHRVAPHTHYTGPLTNIAYAIQQNPAVANNIQRIWWMGGALKHPGNVFNNSNSDGSAEWNVFSDPQAAAIVWNSSVPVTLVPLDATNKVRRLCQAGIMRCARCGFQTHVLVCEHSFCSRSLSVLPPHFQP